MTFSRFFSNKKKNKYKLWQEQGKHRYNKESDVWRVDKQQLGEVEEQASTEWQTTSLKYIILVWQESLRRELRTSDTSLTFHGTKYYKLRRVERQNLLQGPVS